MAAKATRGGCYASRVARIRSSALGLLLGLGLQSSIGCSTVSSQASSASLAGPRSQPLSPIEAEQTANDFVGAFNTGDPKAMTEFSERHSGQRWPQPPENETVARYLQLFNQMGPLRTASITVSESTVVIRARAEKDGWVDVTLFFDPKSSTRVTGRRIEPSEPPPPRLIAITGLRQGTRVSRSSWPATSTGWPSRIFSRAW
jgi:hypothetical protein